MVPVDNPLESAFHLLCPPSLWLKSIQKLTLVPPGNAFGLECLPETVEWIGIKRAADFASDGIFDRVFYIFNRV